ncbi:DUF4239 domain-containing protein [Nocardia sp. NBC_01503]|uniref:bestrophin-like domain n=1 Tax=Nocardia sp. NBC_01503 TaxID=2975997 RepID=UPI002E7AB130|nr:DUF4239 domain-containing protein [Nocardia sp. NBC_01503]WTL32647.1 DUF4239 domain-containing protein [Nocardia sp. NBC_01503]
MALQLGVLALFAVVAVTVFLVGDRVRPKSWRHSDDEASSTMVLDLVNMFFAAIVAFIVVILWQQYDNSHSHTVTEAKALLAVYEAANDLPDSERAQVQGLVHDYTARVVGEEWQVMSRDAKLSQNTQDTFDDLRAAVSALPTADPSVKDIQDKIDTGLDAVADARYDRGMDAEYRLPTFLYVALWFGTGMLLLGTVFSGVVVTKRSVIMTGLFGVVVGAVILAVYQLDRPFAGGNTVSRDAYELALSRFQHIVSGATPTGLPR